jgi:hypothetical protein
MMRTVLFAAFVLLSACGPSPAPQSGDATENAQLSLICDAFAHVSHEALASAYGGDNLSEETLPGPEGESYAATVLYPGDTARRLEIVWRDAAQTAPASVLVSGGGSLWRGPHNIAIGDDLAQIEASNGRAFTLWGFGWDYGGWVSDWQGGAFAPTQGCAVRVGFEAGNDGADAQGDREFASDSAPMRRAAPRVAEFGLRFSD